ncbi:MAG: hypothetical protein KF726_18160, partial [Anaerolineae bacterium]|nr:hypothetical protein [Anaerolineae bacterium]
PFNTEFRELNPQLVLAASWQPGDQQLAVAGKFSWVMVNEDADDSQIEILDVQTGDTVMTLEDRGYHFENVQWSPDGNLIAGISVTKIAFWDAVSGQQVDSYFRLRTDASTRTYSASWSPFGGRLAFVGYIPSDSPRPAYWLAESLVQIVVPAPTTERLKIIAQNCITNEEFRAQLMAQLDHDSLVTVVNELRSSTGITPACVSDLIAVATVVQAES